MNVVFACPLDEHVEELLGRLGPHGPDEAGPSSFSAITQQRELAHHEELTADIQQTEIQAPFGVIEYSKVEDLVECVVQISIVVALLGAQKDGEPRTDGTDGLTVDDDAG